MNGLCALAIFGGLIGTGVAWLLIDRALTKIHAWREKRAMRIRNEELRRYNITPFFGTKERPR